MIMRFLSIILDNYLSTRMILRLKFTENLKHLLVDDAFRIDDKEALEMIFKLLKEEGNIPKKS